MRSVNTSTNLSETTERCLLPNMGMSLLRLSRSA
ncbi:Uncharacterised protein [Mycobacteroides abscessus subsp. abscessus]|nr:Uncharacterised protein [Mycobacteroides abscessus subsp. abscessus]